MIDIVGIEYRYWIIPAFRREWISYKDFKLPLILIVLICWTIYNMWIGWKNRAFCWRLSLLLILKSQPL